MNPSTPLSTAHLNPTSPSQKSDLQKGEVQARTIDESGELSAQLGLFSNADLFAWPCTGPGPLTHLDVSKRQIKHYWRARQAPILSTSWRLAKTVYPAGTFHEGYLLYWRHPSPLTRGDNELDQMRAAWINPDTLKWYVNFVPMIGSGAHWAGSRGQSESLEAAQADCLKRLRRMAGFSLGVLEVSQ